MSRNIAFVSAGHQATGEGPQNVGYHREPIWIRDTRVNRQYWLRKSDLPLWREGAIRKDNLLLCRGRGNGDLIMKSDGSWEYSNAGLQYDIDTGRTKRVKLRNYEQLLLMGPVMTEEEKASNKAYRDHRYECLKRRYQAERAEHAALKLKWMLRDDRGEVPVQAAAATVKVAAAMGRALGVFLIAWFFWSFACVHAAGDSTIDNPGDWILDWVKGLIHDMKPTVSRVTQIMVARLPIVWWIMVLCCLIVRACRGSDKRAGTVLSLVAILGHLVGVNGVIFGIFMHWTVHYSAMFSIVLYFDQSIEYITAVVCCIAFETAWLLVETLVNRPEISGAGGRVPMPTRMVLMSVFQSLVTTCIMVTATMMPTPVLVVVAVTSWLVWGLLSSTEFDYIAETEHGPIHVRATARSRVGGNLLRFQANRTIGTQVTAGMWDSTLLVMSGDSSGNGFLCHGYLVTIAHIVKNVLFVKAGGEFVKVNRDRELAQTAALEQKVLYNTPPSACAGKRHAKMSSEQADGFHTIVHINPETGATAAQMFWGVWEGNDETRQLRGNYSHEPGMSGSPVFNSKGHIVGIHVAGYGMTGYAVPLVIPKVVPRKRNPNAAYVTILTEQYAKEPTDELKTLLVLANQGSELEADVVERIRTYCQKKVLTEDYYHKLLDSGLTSDDIRALVKRRMHDKVKEEAPAGYPVYDDDELEDDEEVEQEWFKNKRHYESDDDDADDDDNEVYPQAHLDDHTEVERIVTQVVGRALGPMQSQLDALVAHASATGTPDDVETRVLASEEKMKRNIRDMFRKIRDKLNPKLKDQKTTLRWNGWTQIDDVGPVGYTTMAVVDEEFHDVLETIGLVHSPRSVTVVDGEKISGGSVSCELLDVTPNITDLTEKTVTVFYDQATMRRPVKASCGAITTCYEGHTRYCTEGCKTDDPVEQIGPCVEHCIHGWCVKEKDTACFGPKCANMHCKNQQKKKAKAESDDARGKAPKEQKKKKKRGAPTKASDFLNDALNSPSPPTRRARRS